MLFCWVKGWEEVQSRGREWERERETHGQGYILAYSLVQHSHCRCNASVCGVDETILFFIVSIRLLRGTVKSIDAAAGYDFATDVASALSRYKRTWGTRLDISGVCIALVLQFSDLVWISTEPVLMETLWDNRFLYCMSCVAVKFFACTWSLILTFKNFLC